MIRALPLLLVLAVPALAEPRELPLTWTARTQQAGTDGLEAWLTPRLARTDDFVRVDTQLAFTRGLAETLETRLSLDMDVEHSALRESFDPRVSSWWRWSTFRPERPFSVGGLGRLSLGPDVLQVELRALAELRTGRTLLAVNFGGEQSALWSGRAGVDQRLEASLGWRFSFSPTASFGLEARGKAAWAQRAFQGSALYVGPALTWEHPSFWVSLGGYAQVAAQRADGDKASPEPQTLRDDERFVLRLTFGTPVRR